jgi:hypothetical protein
MRYGMAVHNAVVVSQGQRACQRMICALRQAFSHG